MVEYEQLWYCEVCKRDGRVVYKEKDDLFSVIRDIEKDHAVSSPDCTAPIGGLILPKDKSILEGLVNGTIRN